MCHQIFLRKFIASNLSKPGHIQGVDNICKILPWTLLGVAFYSSLLLPRRFHFDLVASNSNETIFSSSCVSFFASGRHPDTHPWFVYLLKNLIATYIHECERYTTLGMEMELSTYTNLFIVLCGRKRRQNTNIYFISSFPEAQLQLQLSSQNNHLICEVRHDFGPKGMWKWT